MCFVFDLAPRKADANISKHGVLFDDAMTVFLGHDALTIFDEDHSDDEDRWVMLGEAAGPKLLLVIHLHVEISDDVASVRIISARRPTRNEIKQYRQRAGS